MREKSSGRTFAGAATEMRPAAAVGAPDGGAASSPRAGGWRPQRLAVGVCLVALAVVGLLTFVTISVYDGNENRLLKSRTRELALVLQEALPTIQTPLASAAALADATGGSAPRFREFMAAYVGPGKSFVSVSLWAPRGTAPIAVVGRAPLLALSRARAGNVLARTLRAPALTVTLLHSAGLTRLGYGFSTPGNLHGHIVYAESVLTPSRRAARAAPGSPFADLGYAIYLGRDHRRADLLSTNVARAPVHGRHASATVAFGDRELTVVVSAFGSLGGDFFEWLPWMIAAVGGVLALAAGALTDRLVQRRRRAEQLASTLAGSQAELRRLYHEQQDIAQTLQQAILPEALPDTPGLETSALYEPGTAGLEVGGDWYSLFDVGGGRLVAIVGDVSGRGLRAATAMATLRTAAFSYAAQDSRPGSILARLARLVARQRDGYFATVLCMRIDVERRELTLASAGHLPPLILGQDDVAYVEMTIGVPIGVSVGPGGYQELTITVAPAATVLAFTDGLVERRHEIIDAGLERLRATAASKREKPLGALVAELAQELAPAPTDDDTAILAMRWQDTAAEQDGARATAEP